MTATRPMAKSPVPGATRLDGIDVLRGFACLWVTYCHAHASWGQLEPGRGLLRLFTQFVGIGGKGVDIFVVLSGFCLFYPVAKRSRDGAPQHSTYEFYRRRLNRICPVYFAAIVFALAVIGLGFRVADNRGLRDLWPHVLFIQNMMPDYIARVDGPLWSVALEMQLYLLFPLFALSILKRSGLHLLFGAAFISIVASIGHDHHWLAGRTFDPTASYALPARAVQFIVGMLTASLCVNPKPRIQKLLFCAVPFALAIALAAVAKSMQENTAVRCLGMLAWGLLGSAGVLAVIEVDRLFGRIPQVLVPLQRIGLISFSFYVVHFPIMLAMQPYVARYVHGPVSAVLLYTLLGLPLTLLLAATMFLFVERYTLNYRKPLPRASRLPQPFESSDASTLAQIAG